jgi:hypothetical protein
MKRARLQICPSVLYAIAVPSRFSIESTHFKAENLPILQSIAREWEKISISSTEWTSGQRRLRVFMVYWQTDCWMPEAACHG